MHELGITQQMLEQALAQAQAAGAERITGLNLALGALSDITPDSVQFYFDMLSPGTPAAGAQLSFRQVQPVMRCRQCGTEFAWTAEGQLPSDESDGYCPNCGSDRYDLIHGREFYLESIDVT